MTIRVIFNYVTDHLKKFLFLLMLITENKEI